MPIYEYRCTDCESSFEVLVRPGERGTECPSCHGTHLNRELSVFASSRSDRSGANASCANGGPAMGGGCGGCGGQCSCG